MWARFCQTVVASIDLLLPPACLLCGQQLPAGHSAQSFCRGCQINMQPLSPAHCPRCAQPFPNASSKHLCETCLKRPPSFAKVYTASLYQGSIRDAIQRLKYNNQLTLAQPLGRHLVNTIMTAKAGFSPDRIVPVPLHPARLRMRGFNQALEVARPIARQLGVPLDTTLLQRIRKTPQQQGLSAIERRSNLHNAFALSSQTSKLKVLLIDDVMTTGETVRECSRTLMAGGVAEVQVAVVGRA